MSTRRAHIVLPDSFAREGRTLALIDLLVAATAVHYGLVLATDNVRHFESIPDLHLHSLE